MRALDRHRTRDASDLSASTPEDSNTGNDDLDRFLDQSNQTIADYYTTRRVEETLAAIEAIARHLAGLPGRKNLIWVSGGFPFHIGMDSLELGSTRDRRMFTPEMERATRAVNSANLAIYPVDARGLIGVSDMRPSMSAGFRPAAGLGLGPGRGARRRHGSRRFSRYSSRERLAVHSEVH